MSDKFSDGSSSAYAELPVPAAYLKWTRGNAALKPLAQTDPGSYLGGWRAFTKSMKDNVELPALPIPIVTRTSQDGQHEYEVYAANVIQFLPLTYRTRFELREEVVDKETGKKFNKVVATSPNRLSGYVPYRQIFGLVFAKDTNDYAPAVLKVYTWSAFIAFDRAGQAWNKIAVPKGQALVRRYGTVGKSGKPNFETFGQGHSTPIEAIGLDKPRFVDITPEMDALWEGAQAWKDCDRWNAEGEVVEEVSNSVKNEFFEYCLGNGFTDIETQQILTENSGDYVKALAAIRIDTANGEFEVAEDDLPY